MSEVMNKLTLNGESIKSKRKLFKNFQFLIEKKSELHVWKSTKVSVNLDLNTITFIEKSTKEFIAQHKHRYKSMRWIVMSTDDAITMSAEIYSCISVMIEWLKDLEDTLMSRSDLIRVADQARVDQDLQNHLSFCKMIDFEEWKIFILSQTEAELLNGKMKTMQRIKNDQFKATKAAQITVAQPGFSQPGIVQPELTQQDVAQSGFAQSEVTQSDVVQPDVVQSDVVQSDVVQSDVAQSAVSQSAVSQAEAAQPEVTQLEITQSEVAQSTQADMISFFAVQTMIVSVIQQTIQQYQQQLTSIVTA